MKNDTKTTLYVLDPYLPILLVLLRPVYVFSQQPLPFLQYIWTIFYFTRPNPAFAWVPGFLGLVISVQNTLYYRWPGVGGGDAGVFSGDQDGQGLGGDTDSLMVVDTY